MQALGLVWGDAIAASAQDVYDILEYPGHRGARLLFDVWRARPDFRIGRDLPCRALARVLSNLALYEPQAEDFKVRLAGHALMRHFGHDVTGLHVPSLLDVPHAARHGGAVAALLERSRPLLLPVSHVEDGWVRGQFEMVGLRVLAPDGVTPWAMTGVFYSDWRL